MKIVNKIVSIVAIAAFILTAEARAQGQEEELEIASPEPVVSPLVEEEVKSVEVKQYIEIEKKKDVYAPYQQRRDLSGFSVALTMENYYPANYSSVIDGQSYTTFFDQQISLTNFSLGYKRNFLLSSLLFDVSYGGGTTNSTKSGSTRGIEINKTSLGGTVILDGVMQEPRVAPYLGMRIWQLAIGETAPSLGKNIRNDSGYGYNYTVGLLLQLNWIDEETSSIAYVSHGLENTYIDVFLNQYTKTNAEGDPDTSTSGTVGAGLRLEF